MKKQVRLKSGLIDKVKNQHNFTSDEQMAIVLNEDPETIAALRNGAPVSWVTSMRLAALLGHEYNASPIVEPIPDSSTDSAA